MAFSSPFIISVSCGFLSLFNLVLLFHVWKLSFQVWLSLAVYLLGRVKPQTLVGSSVCGAFTVCGQV